MKVPQHRGAEDLFDSVLLSLERINEENIIKSKFAGVTTDEEAANSGSTSGLWARLERYVGHQIFNIWCSCHRSDLAMEDLFHCVPELKQWQSNLIGLATFYRVSGLRTKELKNIMSQMVAFPRHHEVRFAQHLVQPALAALKNMPGCRQHWQKIVNVPSGEYHKKEKAKRAGFAKTWSPSGGMREWLSAFMVDICSIFRYIEKTTQKPDTIIPDVLQYKEMALQKFDLFEDNPYLGRPVRYYYLCT